MMLDKIVPQVEESVKCDIEWCDEPQFRSSGLCFDHFVQEELAAWNDWDAERQMVLESIGYLWGDPVREE